MVRLITFIRTGLLLAALAHAAPTRKRDSAVGDEVAVSAPNGTPESDLAALSTQLATTTSLAPPIVTPPPTSSDNSTSSSDDSSNSDTSDSSDASETASSSSDGSVSSGGSSGYDSSSDSSYGSDSGYGSVSSGGSYGSVSSGSSYNYPQYGSGGSNWQSGYTDCVQQCMATYQPPPSVYYPPTSTSSYGGYQGDDSVSSGSSDDESADVGTVGAAVTHTIIVAPTQGVLRYVPFITNASVGDILEFQWGAGPHTVTRSSELTPCNKTLASDVFASGPQNKSFIFHELVNDTNPIFFYCGIPTHCEKGMFGIVNPPNASGPAANSTVAALMPQWAAADPDVNAALDFVTSKTAGTAAATWGDSTDVSGVDSASYPELARNVLYTRYFISLNPGSLDAEGNFRPSTNLKIPADFSSLLAQASAGSNGTSTVPSGSASAPAASMTGSAGMSSTPGYGTPNGAASLSSSTVSVVAAAIVAAFFAL